MQQEEQQNNPLRVEQDLLYAKNHSFVMNSIVSGGGRNYIYVKVWGCVFMLDF